jgi:hypothetical protein
MNESAVLFARIANTKTLTRETLATIKKLGYRIENVAESLESILAAPNYDLTSEQRDRLRQFDNQQIRNVDNFVNAMTGSK